MGQVMAKGRSLAQGDLPRGDCCAFGRWYTRKVLAMYRRMLTSERKLLVLEVENARLRAIMLTHVSVRRAQLG